MLKPRNLDAAPTLWGSLRGHSTPIVVGDRLYLTTSDKEKDTQSLIALDRKSGKLLWNQTIHKGGYPSELHQENSTASASAQWDGLLLVRLSKRGDRRASAISASTAATVRRE